uniref:Uncharacterized protein n=1 Tax=Mycena chlorophos TaxID=658473 RepID=A0ABQ0LIK4_MYCCL|nr:predicted protein [Mycena chlorophos]
MSTPLTFRERAIENSQLIGLDDVVYYKTSTTTSAFNRPKLTLVQSATDSTVGRIDWRERTFTINGERRPWALLKSSPKLFSAEREWRWYGQAYRLKYDWSNELTATPQFRGAGGETVRFSPFQPRILGSNTKAVIWFPPNMDATARMFLLMAVIHMDIRRQERRRRSAAGGLI